MADQPATAPGYFGTDVNVQSWLDQNLAGYLEQNPGAIQWKTLLGASSIFIPTGVIFDYGSATAPQGFVLCDGSTYDGTNGLYLNLWSIIGVTYGGSGQNSFQVPDLRGRVSVGLAVTGGHTDVSTIGLNDGVAVANRRPTHNSSKALTGPSHTHTGGLGTVTTATITGDYVGNPNAITGVTAVASASTGSGGTGSVAGTIGPAGTNPIDTPAYVVLNRIIKL